MKLPLVKLSWIVGAKFLFVLLFILYAGVGLGPDEAQYWTWSQDLSLGYYSKPPGIAYQIALGTSLFGNTELGVRFGALLIASITPFLMYFFAKVCKQDDQTAMWAGIIWAISPMGFAGSFLSITDGGMILFWILAAIILHQKGPGVLLGLIIAAGALFKWPIYLFWIFALLGFARSWDKRWLIAISVSLLGLLPSLIWNIQHDFVTFRHVGATLQGGSGTKASGNFLEFVGSQIALLSPIFFGLIFIAYKKWDKELIFSYLTTLPLLAVGAIMSLFMKVQGNWAIAALPTGALLAAVGGKSHPKWLKAGSILSLVMIIAALIFVPFKHNRGWDKLAPALSQAGYSPSKDFLFADKYQNTSLLSFYAPEQKRAYFFNLKGDRLNQFSFWPSMKDEQEGKDGYYVTFDQEEPNLTPYFTHVEKVGSYPLTDKKQAHIYRGTHYNGQAPVTPQRY